MAIPHHIHPLQWAMAGCGALAMLSAHFGYLRSYAVLKPLTMVIALVCAWVLCRPSRRPIAWLLLLLGLLLSLVGDVSLLFEQGFVCGLAAFLGTHLAYIAMLRRDTRPWFPQRPALLGLAVLGAGLYAYLWTHGLPADLRVPVLVYVCVIVLMVAQAVGRASVLHTRDACYVATGALSFLVSDALLAIDRFVQPLPGAYLWVLGFYYLAQWLILHGMLPTLWEHSPSEKHSY